MGRVIRPCVELIVSVPEDGENLVDQLEGFIQTAHILEADRPFSKEHFNRTVRH
jgi:hypothetical protein